MPRLCRRPEIAEAALAKQRADEREYAELVENNFANGPGLQRNRRRHE